MICATWSLNCFCFDFWIFIQGNIRQIFSKPKLSAVTPRLWFNWVSFLVLMCRTIFWSQHARTGKNGEKNINQQTMYRNSILVSWRLSCNLAFTRHGSFDFWKVTYSVLFLFTFCFCMRKFWTATFEFWFLIWILWKRQLKKF